MGELWTMDLMNPYDKPDVGSDFPFFLGVIYVIATLLLLVSFYLLLIRTKKNHSIREKLPEWLFSAAYPAFFLTMPFVMVVTVMILFPCWFKACP